MEKDYNVTVFTDCNDIFSTWDRIDKYIHNEYMPKTNRHKRPNLYIILDNYFTIQITVTHDAWGEYSTYIVQKSIDRSKPDHLIKKSERDGALNMQEFIKKYLLEYYYTLDEKVTKYKKIKEEYEKYEAHCRYQDKKFKKLAKMFNRKDV